MRKAIVLTGVLYGLLVMWLAAAAPAVAATAEEVLAKLAKNEGEVKTFEADMKTIAKAGEKTHELTGHIATQAVLKDGKRTGTLLNVKQQMAMDDGSVINTLVVNDGEFLWMETRHPQMGVMVMKNKADAGNSPPADPQKFRDQYDLKLAGEEEFDGQKMWVLEGTPKEKAADAPPAGGMGPQALKPAKVHIYIGQKDLLCHRFRSYDKEGNETADVQFTNIKVNGALDPALFKYTPPPGARVMDMTKGTPDIRGMMKNLPKGKDAGDE